METKLRDLSHILLGFVLVYCIGSWTGFGDFPLFDKIIAGLFIGGIVGLCMGFFIEWLHEVTNIGAWSWSDIRRTAYGGIIGGLMAAFLPNILWLMLVTSVIPLYFIISDLIKIYKLYNK